MQPGCSKVITTSRRGRHNIFLYPPRYNLSTHDLTQRSTLLPPFQSSSLNFQLTTSRRGRLDRYLRDLVARAFQLTTSRRGRQKSFVRSAYLYIFQLTTSRRGRPARSGHIGALQAFNSRPHAEVDRPDHISLPADKSFNSRPHAEVDRSGCVIQQ